MISWAVKTISTACLNEATSKLPSPSRNFMRFSDARLHALLSRCMYSEHGLLALIRPVAGHVCHSLIVVSYCIPGSAQSHAACPCLALLMGLAPDEVPDVGVIHVEDDHLGRSTGLAAGLDRAGRSVGA